VTRNADGPGGCSATGGRGIEHAPGEEGRGGRVVRRQRAIGEVVLVAGVEEQLPVRGLADELPGGVDVPLAHEDRVRVHAVHLHRYPGRPGRAELGHRDAGKEQQRAARARPVLRQVLGGQDPEGEARVHDVRRESLDGPGPAPQHLGREADLLRVPHPLADAAEGAAVKQVGRMDGVPGAAQLAGESSDARGQSLRVVEEHYLSHRRPPHPAGISRRYSCRACVLLSRLICSARSAMNLRSGCGTCQSLPATLMPRASPEA
jgi:hypothetical protein